jgi:putative membrane protein
MNMYEGYHFWGMHLVWWFIWLVFIFWIFAIPYNIPGQRSKKEAPLDLLKRRFTSGQISKEEYLESKQLLQ